MPTNKNFTIRVEILDELLGSVRQRTGRELLEALNETLVSRGHRPVSRRTLYQDLAFLRDQAGAPIQMGGRPGDPIYYTEPFSLKNVPLDTDDIDFLRKVSEFLKQVAGSRMLDDLQRIIRGLENRIHTGELGGTGIIQFEDHTVASGTEFIDDLFEAIRGQTALRVKYKPFHYREASEFVFHAYLLKEYRSRWFVLGRKSGGDRISTLALDRLQLCRPSRDPYIPNTILDPGTFFENLIGVSVPPDSEPQDISIWVSAQLAPYVRTKPIHRSQEILMEYGNGDLMIRLKLYVNMELIAVLLGYGARLEVISPFSLRDTLRRETTAMHSRYEFFMDGE